MAVNVHNMDTDVQADVGEKLVELLRRSAGFYHNWLNIKKHNRDTGGVIIGFYTGPKH